LPPESLDRITAKLEPDERKNFTTVANSVYGMRYAKYFVSFSRTEWNTLVKPNITNDAVKDWTMGRYTSDNSLQQVFAWYPGTQGRENDQVMTAEECDVIVFQFYGDDPIVSRLTEPRSNIASCDADAIGQAHSIPAGSLQIILENFATMIGLSITDLPTPLRSQYRYHSQDDPQTRTDAWHNWALGSKHYEVFEDALQPAAGVPLYMAGESFSTNQGWGHGAMQTAEYMLQEKMGVKAPSWLSKTEYCDLMPFYTSERKQNYTTVPQCHTYGNDGNVNATMNCTSVEQ